MALTAADKRILEACEREVPVALPGEVLVRVRTCGVCQTDVHILEGELTPCEFPVVPGHEIVGVVEVAGDGVTRLAVGDRVGIAWLGHACGACAYCASARENLCRHARFTGFHMDGGYAEYAVADAEYAFKLPDGYTDAQVAPLLCDGVNGYRAYRLAGDARRLGLYGFGVAACVVAQIGVHHAREIYAFTSPGDEARQTAARSLGCAWAGAWTDAPPAPLDAAIVFGPDGRLVTAALSRVAAGGVVVCAGMHMSDIPGFRYADLQEERVIRSVTNHTREDVRELLALAAAVPFDASVETYDLADANRAIADLRERRIPGAAILTL